VNVSVRVRNWHKFEILSVSCAYTENRALLAASNS
jgi:hypothetical protein